MSALPSSPLLRAVSSAPRLTMSVIVPTYRRPDDLARCLEGLISQTRPPDQVIVTVRLEDSASRERAVLFAGRLPLEVVELTVGGVVAAINAGIDQATGDIIAITDDDAVPRGDWLLRMERLYLADNAIAGVGGRDHVHQEGRVLDGARRVVGKVQWFGRVVGNHHLGVGEARDVDVLKGANWSFRRSAVGSLRLDPRLRGPGAQVANELAFSLQMRRRGWRLVYDPLVAVDHYPSVRHDIDKRGRAYFHPKAKEDAAHNDTLSLLDFLPAPRRIAFSVWASLIGTGEYPGFAQAIRLVLAGDPHAIGKTVATLRGRAAGWRTFLDSRQ